MRYWYVIIALLVAGCSKELLEPDPVDRGLLPISPYVAIGGSETAGFADGALHLEAQLYSYPALIVQQLREVGNISFAQPLTVDTGGYFYANGRLYSKLALDYVADCNDEKSLVPVREEADGGTLASLGAVGQVGPYGNLAVPFLKTYDISRRTLAANSSYYRRMNSDNFVLQQAIINRNPSQIV